MGKIVMEMLGRRSTLEFEQKNETQDLYAVYVR